VKSTKAIAAEFKKRKQMTKSRLRSQYSNTKKCQSFYAGDFSSYEDHVDFTNIRGEKKRSLVKFSKVKPYVNAVKGFMAQNRTKPKYEARVEQAKIQEMFSLYANAVAEYCRDNANADQIETQQDGDMLINGYGVVETALSYGEGYCSSEIDGEILKMRLDPLSTGWDPHARATNLLDRRWDYYAKEYNLEEALSLFSDTDEEDFEEVGDDESEQYDYTPNGGTYDKIAPVEYTDQEENLVKVYFYQWYDIEQHFKVANPLYEIDDPQTLLLADSFLQSLVDEDNDEFDPRAEVLHFDASIKTKLEEYFDEYMDEVFEFNRKVYYEAVLSGEKVFTAYKSQSQQGYRRQFKTGDYDASKNIWVGMVNSMMEPVMYYNKALTELMFTIAANSKGGVIAEEDAIEDIAEFERNYAKTDGVAIVAVDALTQSKVQPKGKPALPTGLETIVGLADGALTDVNGFDTSFMGSREFANDTASFQRQRVKQAMSLLACYFDSATLYQKQDGRIMLDLMRVFVENNQNMAIRVTGEQGQAMFLRLQTKQLSAEYDLVVSEAPLSVQDKQEQAQILNTMGDKLIMVDPPAAKIIYAMAIDLMPLDHKAKERIKKTLAPEEGDIDPAYVKKLERDLQQLTDVGRKAELERIQAGAKLDVARAADAEAKARNTDASTVKVIEEAEQKSLENEAIKRSNISDVSINI